jgi:hypothetical protein
MNHPRGPDALRKGARGLSGREDAEDRNTERSGNVERAGIVTHEQRRQ